MAKELFHIGDLIRAKDLLNEAYKHASVLVEKEDMGEIHLYLGKKQFRLIHFINIFNFYRFNCISRRRIYRSPVKSYEVT